MLASPGGLRRRPAGPWTGAVAGVLDELAAAGVPAPCHVGMEGDCEVVTHLEGLVPARPYPPEVTGDQALASVGALLRRHHEALAPRSPAGFQRLPGWPQRPPDTICHNDCGPWNIVYRHGRAVALIDWDLARPGPGSLDLALAAWHHVPLYADDDARRFGWEPPVDRRHRLRVLCQAYGSRVTVELLDDVALWQEMTIATVRWAHTRPDDPAARPWLKVDIAGVESDRRWLARHRRTLL